jgi:hypothetical protein
MARLKRTKAAPLKGPRLSLATSTLIVVAIALPVIVAILLPWVPSLGAPPKLLPGHGTSLPLAQLALEQKTIGPAASDQPLIAHVQIVDLDNDGRNDLLVCDARRNAVLWYRCDAVGQWDEEVLAELAAPCHVIVVDLDTDGDRDIIVAVLGSIWPTDEPVGQVVWLENFGHEKFATRVLADDVRRIADVQSGDLDGDGDHDLVVAEFGYDHGRIFWLENRGQQFWDHELLAVPGPIHVPLRDFDADGDLDIAALISQDAERVVAFVNSGGGKFELRNPPLYASANFDLGTSGLFPCDLNGDGREDLLLTAGDNLEIQYPCPQAWHGCLWLENHGDWNFTSHRLANVAGVYAAAAGDLDGDHDRDVVLACMFNQWNTPGTASLVWLENNGQQQFVARQIADHPTHLATLDVGDLNQDGSLDIVAGSLHLQEPFDRLGRVTAWLSRSTGSGRQGATK